MNEMQDKELDDLFRKSLTDPEIPFDPDAWKAMEAKLDADDRRRTGYFWLYAGVVAGIFLLVGSLYVAKQNNTESLAQAGKNNTVAVEHSPIASSENTAADQPGALTDSGIPTNNINSNAVNQNEAIQQAGGETETSLTEKSHADASNQTSVADAAQPSGIKNTLTKKTAATTGSTDAKQYNGTKQQHLADYSNTSTNSNNNHNTKATVQKGTSKDAAAMNAGAAQQATASSEQQSYVAGNKKRVENNNNIATKNNTAEKGITTGVTGTTAGAEKAVLSSDKRTAGTDVPGVAANTNSTRTNSTATNTTINNNTEADPVNANSTANASALRDTTQQHTNSDLNTDAQNAVLVGEHAAHKTSDSLAIVAAEPAPAKADSTIALADTSSTQKEDKKESFKRGFSLSLILGPEYNGPTNFNFYKPNLNIGFNVEYYILPRLSVVSGAVYGQKLYTCDASDYASSPSYVRYGRTYYPDYVKANCGVLDIPVNVRYKFLNKKTFNVYASTGLSSYFMLKETYIFQYSKYNRPDDEYQVHNKNRYLFNIWNVSLGVEKRINDTWSVQAEPYVKIPLNGVGAGDIKLVSTGVYFSLKYYFK